MRKFKYLFFFFAYKTSLFLAIEKENVEIVKLLLSLRSIKVNLVSYKNNYRQNDAYQI